MLPCKLEAWRKDARQRYLQVCCGPRFEKFQRYDYHLFYNCSMFFMFWTFASLMASTTAFAVKAEGDVYHGEWKDDKRHGKGVVTYVKDLDFLQWFHSDFFVLDCCSMWSIFYFLKHCPWDRSSGFSEGMWCKVSARGSVVEKFEGDWVNGKMHGNGKRHGWKCICQCIGGRNACMHVNALHLTKSCTCPFSYV